MAFQHQDRQPYGHQQQPYGAYQQQPYETYQYLQPLSQPLSQTQQHSQSYAAQQDIYNPRPVPQKTDCSYKPVQQSSDGLARSQKQARFSGVRVSLGIFSAAALLVLAANVGISIYSIRQYGGKATASFKTIYTGNCKKTKELNTVIHLIINVLSSILLGASNYSMQVLTAPTRKQIDKAHARRKWLDIGIPSIRNLKSMGHKRRILWTLILISSAPLHLVYNSIFSQSWTRQAYEAALVTEDFLNGSAFDAGYTELSADDFDQRRLFAEIQTNSSIYQRLEVMDCIKAYNKRAIIDRKTVLVVTSSPRPISSDYSSVPTHLSNGNPNPIYATSDFVGNAVVTSTWDWMCEYLEDYSTYPTPKCDLSDVLAGKKEWSPFLPNIKVEYCLSEYLGESCTLDFSFGLMAIVCVCNLIKLACMMTLFLMRSHAPLLNIGDAVSSFLAVPDITTAGMCLAGKKEINQFWKKNGYAPTNASIIWTARPSRWFRASSVSRWIIFTALSVTSILITTVLLAIGLKNPRTITGDSRNGSGRPWWKSGFGAANIDQDSKYVITQGKLLYQPQRLVANILLANLPQLVISFLFLAYNSILTSMLMAKEWSEFAHSRKTLRVTSPSGQQRSTYWLSLPYRFAIPLLVISMLLHWLTSQAIFLDRRMVQQVWWGKPYTDNNVGSVSTVGYSPLAILLCLILGLAMLLALVGLGLRKYKAGIPLAASCSAAISAACHSPRGESDIETSKLQWGVVGAWQGTGHCSFSAQEVEMPQSGYPYAGL